MKRFLLLGAFLCTMPLAAAAETQALKCDLNAKPGTSFSQNHLILLFNVDKQQAAVLDAMIQNIYGKQTAARLARRGKQIDFNWVVKDVPGGSGRRLTIDYRARLTPETGKISVRGHLHGYNNMPATVYGTCVPTRYRAPS